MLAISESQAGNRELLALTSQSPAILTPPGVSRAWGQYATVDDAYAWSYRQDGRWFYVVSFPSAKRTWVFDQTTRIWHERRGHRPEDPERPASTPASTPDRSRRRGKPARLTSLPRRYQRRRRTAITSLRLDRRPHVRPDGRVPLFLPSGREPRIHRSFGTPVACATQRARACARSYWRWLFSPWCSRRRSVGSTYPGGGLSADKWKGLSRGCLAHFFRG